MLVCLHVWITSCGIFHTNIAPSEPTETMYCWLGDIATSVNQQYLIYSSGMSLADSVTLGIVISPQFHLAVIAGADEHVTFFADCQSIDLRVIATLNRPDQLAVKRTPV